MDRDQNTPASAFKGGRGVAPKAGARKLRNDIVFISALLVTVTGLGLGFFLLRGEGSTVTVEVGKQVYGTYSLSEDLVVDIPTGDGELNRLVIRDGKAYMEYATCPDGICAAHRPISRKGESIVCLPHHVVVTVTGGGEDAPGEISPDIIA